MSTDATVRCDTFRSLAFGSISGTYANVGTALTSPCTIFKISNNTDGDMIFSVDGGLTDHMFLAAGSFTLYDLRANMKPRNQDDYVLIVGSQFSVKEVTTPTSGDVYVEIIT